MTKIFLSLIAVAGINFASCKSSKKTTKAGTIISETKQTLAPNTFRFIASFISIGGGSDYKTLKEYKEFVADYSTKIGKKIESESISWGREGEVDLCFKLTELSNNEADAFVNESKKFLSKSKLINIIENAPCNHKR